MNIPDMKIMEAASDVMVRYCAHDQYGDRSKALKAFGKRCRAIPPAEVEELFNFLETLYRETVVVVKSAAKKAGDQQDLDESMKLMFNLAQDSLKTKWPGYPDSFLVTFVNWVIYWHILR